MNQKVKGITAVMISAIAFGFVPVLAMGVYGNGGTAYNVAFLRFALATPILLVILLIKKVSLSITKRQLFQLARIVLFGYGITAILLFFSYNYIPIGMATTIHFSYPIFVILGCFLFYRERLSLIKGLAVILCSCGILLFYDGSSGSSLMGIGIAFLSGITYAYYIITLEKSGLNEMHPLKLTFYLCLIAAIFAFLFILVTGNVSFHMNFQGWLCMLALSLLAALVAVTLLQVGIGLIGPQDAAILSTFEPITSTLLGVLLFQEHFTLRTAGGCILVLGAVLLTTLAPDQKKKKPEPIETLEGSGSDSDSEPEQEREQEQLPL